MTTLHVLHWRHELAVPRDWESGRGQEAATDVRAMTQEVAALLAEALEQELEADSVVLLPALRIEARFDPRADRHAACAQWAGQLAVALLGALREPASDVLHFPSRAHHAAAYLLARTRGQTAGCWWWTSFAGLAALPLSQALRTVLAEEGVAGLAMLAALDESDASAVLAGLGESEGWRVLLAWCEQFEAAAVVGGEWPGLAAALRADARIAPAPAAAALLALRRQALAGASPAPGACDVVRAAAAALLAAAAASGTRAADRDPLAPASGPARALLRRLDGRGRQALAQALRHAPKPPRAGASGGQEEEQEALNTAFGGGAWLLHSAQGLLASAGDWPWPEPLGRGMFALLTLAAAMPPSRALGAWRDPAWRRILEVPAGLDLDAACTALAGAADAAAAARDAWVTWLARTARETCLLRQPGEAGEPAADWPVDRESGLWLPAELADALPPCRALSFGSRLALTRAVRGEVRFLAANEVTQRLPPAWQPLVMRFAHAALRGLALRIPGMGWASAAHPHANVLGVPGTLRPAAAGEDWVLQLERPPLDVLLAMTGLARARWPVLPGRWLVLARADGARP